MAEEKKTVKKAAAPKKEAAKKAPAKKAAPKKAAEKTETPAEVKESSKPVEAKKSSKPVETPVAKAPVTEARCFARDIRITPRKVRLAADLVRGKDVKDALGLLATLNRVSATPVSKAIQSAAANAANNFGMDKDRLYVAEIQVSDGLKIKRFIPRAKGGASQIIKRNANLLVVVKERK